jgi:hypothetical protein
MPYLSEVEPDEAGPDLAEVCQRYGIAPESMIMMSRNETHTAQVHGLGML